MPKRLLNKAITKRAERDLLVQVEIDWPDSRGLLERLAVGLMALHGGEAIVVARLAAIASSGIAAHRHAKADGRADRARWAAFVAGLGAQLDRAEHPLLAAALTARQLRILDRQIALVPPSPRPDPGAVDAG